MRARIFRSVMWILVSIDAIGTLWLATLSLFGGYLLDQGTWEYVGGGNGGAAAAVILFGAVVAAVIVLASRSLLRRD
ncbi:MAG: hypothetical protein K9H50_03310 [Aurantimicrobium sp.]|nr:hypothetical protein [Aurantimicrobium sp.]